MRSLGAGPHNNLTLFGQRSAKQLFLISLLSHMIDNDRSFHSLPKRTDRAVQHITLKGHARHRRRLLDE